MAIYVTSNLQLGRPGAIKKYKREYDNVDQMTEDLINKWNSVVKQEDTVYHLGNFAWDPKTAQEALLRLNGTIYFTRGDHDKALEVLEEKGMLRARVKLIDCLTTFPELNLSMTYWPLKVWPGKTSKKSYNIIGYPEKKFKSEPKDRIINVSTDLWKNQPQDLHRLLEIFSDF
jgi:calcineurin-like phosphoesterase family protein|tara:strand:- start:736 stop:1254 length:519 start_codon:yes stop_codon:yes gene_type:complete